MSNDNSQSDSPDFDDVMREITGEMATLMSLLEMVGRPGRETFSDLDHYTVECYLQHCAELADSVYALVEDLGSARARERLQAA